MKRRSYVHEEEVPVFLVLYCANVLKYVNNYNLKMLLDLIVKLVVDYTNVRLIPRDFVAGKKCDWNKGKYKKCGVIGGIIRGSRDDTVIPYGDDYEIHFRKQLIFLFMNQQ